MGRVPHSSASPLELPGGADVSSEVVVLARVARCFQHSPIVEAIVAQMKDEDAIPAPDSEAPAGRR